MPRHRLPHPRRNRRPAAPKPPPSSGSPIRASPAPIRIWPATKHFQAASRCLARRSRTPWRAVKSGDARYGMIPIENSVAGRVADIHHLLPNAGLFIVGEHFLRVHHQLMALPCGVAATVKQALSHVQASGQCRNTLRKLGLKPVPEADTAGSARMVAEANDPSLRGHRLDARRRDLRPQDPDAATSRTRSTTPPASSCCRPSRTTPARRRAVRDHLHFPRAQHAGGALQGDGRLCHQRRQHDQARELSGRRRLRRHDVLMPTSTGHPVRPRRARGRWRNSSYFSATVQILGTYKASPYRAQIAAPQARDALRLEADRRMRDASRSIACRVRVASRIAIDGQAARTAVCDARSQQSPSQQSSTITALSMFSYIVRRLAFGVLTIVGVSIVVFVVMRILPGDPLVAIFGPDGFTKLTDERARPLHGATSASAIRCGCNISSWVKDIVARQFRPLVLPLRERRRHDPAARAADRRRSPSSRCSSPGWSAFRSPSSARSSPTAGPTTSCASSASCSWRCRASGSAC